MKYSYSITCNEKRTVTQFSDLSSLVIMCLSELENFSHANKNIHIVFYDNENLIRILDVMILDFKSIKNTGEYIDLKRWLNFQIKIYNTLKEHVTYTTAYMTF